MLHFHVGGHSFQALKRKKQSREKTHASVSVTVVQNPDRAKNQSDCRIRYRARLEKNNSYYFFSEASQRSGILNP